MQNNLQTQNVIEISLKDFCKKLLIQWRAVLVFSLIVGILLSCVKYARDVNSYKASAVESEQDVSSEEAIKNSGLTDDEIDAVEQAVLQKKKIEDLTTYTTESMYMNIDAMNCKQLSILYYIKADKGADAADLLSIYKNMLSSDGSIKRIKEAMGIKVSAKYVRELISVYEDKPSDRGAMSQNASTDIMKVIFNLPDDTDSESVENTIEKLISEYDINATGITSGTIHRIMSDVNVVMNTDMQNSQTSTTSNLNSLKSTYTTTVNAFSDEQKRIFDVLLQDNNLSSDEVSDITEVSKPSFSKKWFLVGFLIGILLYAFIMLIHELLSTRCSSIVSYKNYGSLLGRMVDSADINKKSFLIDKFTFRNVYKKNANVKKEIDRILARAEMNSSDEDFKHIELWTVGFDASSYDIVKAISDKTSYKNINATIEESYDGQPDDMIDKVAPGKNIMLIVKDGLSRKKDVIFITEMLNSRKADYLGMVEIL